MKEIDPSLLWKDIEKYSKMSDSEVDARIDFIVGEIARKQEQAAEDYREVIGRVTLE